MGHEDSQLAQASLATIMGTGLVLGLVHVLTGPDHLSAIAAMASNSSWKAFGLGIRWGCGHSTGLVIVTAIFLAAGRNFDLDRVGGYCNYVVGVFMLALGLWTMVHYQRKFYHQRNAHLQENDLEKVVDEEQLPVQGTPVLVGTFVEMKDENQEVGNAEDPRNDAIEADQEDKDEEDDTRCAKHVSIVPEDDALSKHQLDQALIPSPRSARYLRCCRNCRRNASVSDPTTQKFAALMVGIVHGVAGPGGVLGVLPAIVLDDWVKSTSYLGCFCLSLILTMGVFAACYGEVTGRVSRNSALVEYRIGVVSSAFSLVVGLAWIVLQATGQMDKVFE